MKNMKKVALAGIGALVLAAAPLAAQEFSPKAEGIVSYVQDAVPGVNDWYGALSVDAQNVVGYMVNDIADWYDSLLPVAQEQVKVLAEDVLAGNVNDAYNKAMVLYDGLSADDKGMVDEQLLKIKEWAANYIVTYPDALQEMYDSARPEVQKTLDDLLVL